MGLSSLDKPSSKPAIAAKAGVSKFAAIISAKEKPRSSGRPHFPPTPNALVASATITVPKVAIVAMSASSTEMYVGEAVDVTAQPESDSGTPLCNRTVVWQSSSSSVSLSQVSPYKVKATGVSVGAATVTAVSEGVPGSMNLTVKVRPIPTENVTLNLRTYTYSNTDFCRFTVVFSGYQQVATANAASGDTTFTIQRDVDMLASTNPDVHSTGGLCDVSVNAIGLQAGFWSFQYQIRNGNGANCSAQVPMSPSNLVNFTNGKVGCVIGTLFVFP